MNHFHKPFLGFVALVALVSFQPLRAQYPLSVESYPAVQEGLTTYRFYVSMQDSTDRLSAVYGNDDTGMYISTPDGAFNSGFNVSWSASGLNPALVNAFPEMADDTYATIGLTGPASSSGIPNAADPGIVEDSSQTITPFFNNNGATALECNTLIGSSWFVLNDAGNGLPKEDMRVLILQVTTSGGVSGTLNYQVFPQGDGANAVYMSESFIEPVIPGCMDAQSCTFEPEATYEDGSCEYVDALGVCGGDCDEPSQFNPEICAGEEVFGCEDSSACNYEPTANVGNGSCKYLDVIGVCGGECSFDEDNDGICDDCSWVGEYHLELDVVKEHTDGELAGMTTYQLFVRCLDPDDYIRSVSGAASSPLIIKSSSGVWYNNPLNESWNASGIDPSLVDENPLLAYDSYLTIGSSNSEEGPFPNGFWTAIDPRPEFQPNGGSNLVVDAGSGANYLVFPGLEFTNSHPGFAGDDLRVLLMQLTTSGSIEGQLNVSIFPNGNASLNTLFTLGWDSQGVCFNLDECVGEYDDCGVCNGPGAIYSCGCASIPDGACDCEGTMVDALGVCGGICDADVDGDGVCDSEEVTGCDDILACNYKPEATENDGSCFYSPPFYSCDGACLNDSDFDGVCDELSEFEYPLVVEASPSLTDVGKTYRFYVQMEDASDRMSAVFGTDSMNLQVQAPAGVFNSPFNLGWSASGINPAFLSVFPELVDDSYATIGLTGPASSSELANAADPALVEDPEQPISGFFIQPNQTTLLSSTLIGSSWYVLNTDANGLPDENGRVLVMQVTTEGPLYGRLNYQVFPLGQQGVERRLSAYFHGEGVFAAMADSVLGCTDEDACNFNPNATTDDGSCTQFDECGLCGGPGIPAGECDCEGTLIDDCGVCGGDNSTCAGCTSEVACNFNSSALVADLSLCVFATGPCEICAGNADDGTGYVQLNDDDGDFICNDVDTCLGDLDAVGVCNGSCTADLDADGICDDVDDCVGEYDECGICGGSGIPEGECDCDGNLFIEYCLNVNACNFQDTDMCVIHNPELCLFEDALGECGGDCAFDVDGDGVCDDVDDCIGAFDACGVCNGPGDIYECGCTDIPPGDCDCNGNVLDAIGVCGGDCVEDLDSDGICDDVDDCVGEYDECGVCNGPGAIYECGCANIPPGDCDCNGNVLDAIGVCGGLCEVDSDGDGICDDEDACVASEYCGWGTVWNADSAACVLAVPPFLGEFGDYNTLNPCYYDLDLSGSVGAGDLINFLSTYNLETGCSWTEE